MLTVKRAIICHRTCDIEKKKSCVGDTCRQSHPVLCSVRLGLRASTGGDGRRNGVSISGTVGCIR